MRRASVLAALAVAVAAGTVAAGWWTVPPIVLAWGWLAPVRPIRRWQAMAAASVGWALVLGWAALHGPVGTVALRVGGVLGLPPAGFVAVTLLFPALLAGATLMAAGPRSPTG